MTDPMSMTGAALKAAEMIAPEVVKTGARRVGRHILGTPAERGMQDVYTRSITGLLVKVAKVGEGSGEAPDPEAMKVAETVLEDLCSDDEAAGLLLNVALRPGPVPVEALRSRAAALGSEPDTLPFVFDDAMETLAGKVWEEFLSEAGKHNSRIQPLVNEAMLATVRSLYRAAISTSVGPDYSEAAPPQLDPDELDEALRTLEGLPLEEVPDRSQLPHPAVMPLRRNPNFVGRREDLKKIAAVLKAGGAAAVGEATVAASSGLGGVGKTQLACEFVYRYGRYFHGVYWLDFGDPESIPAEVASCGGAGGMNLRPRDFHTLPMEQRVEAVMGELQSELPRLLVFDNCEDENLLERWLPPTGGCRVLVTSRRGSWDPSLSVTDLELGVLGRDDSVELLRKYRPDLPADDPDLHAIAEELGDLPLALDLAGRYLKRYARDVAPSAYLAEIRRPELLEHPSLREARGLSPTKHDMDVWRTFALSYWRLDAEDETDGRAIKLLARAARLTPGEPMPGELLVLSLDPSGDPGTEPAVPATLSRDALDRLTEVGLLGEETEGAFGMHRLVAAFALAEVPEDGATAAVEEACARAALEAFSEGHPARQELLVPHVRPLADAAMERVDDAAANLCTAAGVGLGQLGAHDEALPYAQRAMDITADLHGPNDHLTLQRRSNVGMLLKSKGEREPAMAVYKEVLEAQETHLGREDIDVAATINNIGVLLRGEDLFHEMLPLYERALRIRERIWKKTGRRDPQRRANAYKLAESHANMGALLLDLGRPRQAGPHLDSALSILGGEFGQNHERNAGTLVMRAAALRALGIYPETMTSVESALEIYGDVTTNVPPEAGRALSNLGSILAELAEDEGVYEEQRAPLREMAGNWLQLALVVSERGYGEDHPTTGGLNQALGSVRDAQQATEDARVHRERAEACRRINLGGTDAEAADAINEAGRSLMDWGLYDEAQAYLERTLEIRENVLGEWSFGASTSHFNLGILLQLRGRDEQARPYLQRSLAIRTNICGETHPATEMVRENLRILDS
jgi:tetratricopeptide (TPR) repeat protein